MAAGLPHDTDAPLPAYTHTGRILPGLLALLPKTIPFPLRTPAGGNLYEILGIGERKPFYHLKGKCRLYH